MKQRDDAPLPPAGSISPDAVVEIASPSGEYRALALRGSDGLLRVGVFQYLYDEAVDEASWSQISPDSITDTVATRCVLTLSMTQSLSLRALFAPGGGSSLPSR